MLLKNTAGQGVYLFAYKPATNATDAGDAANITGSYALDGTNTNGFSTANPTEMGGGVYWQPLAQAETNANAIAYRWASSTSGVQVTPVLVLTTGVSLPVAAYAAANGIITEGTGTGQLTTSSGAVLLQATQTGVTIPTVTTVTNQLTAAAIATGVWQDSTGGDFTTASSIGKSLYTAGVVPGGANGLFIAGTNAATVITTSLTTHFIGTVDTVTTVTNQLTAAAIATGVWQDATAGDFTTASSVGKCLYIANVVPGAAGGHFIAGTNAATAVTITGNLVGTVSTLTTYTGNTPQTGDSFARLGAPNGASIDADILTRLSTAGYTTPPTAAAIGAVVAAGAVASVTGAVGSVTAPVTISLTQALNIARAVDAIIDTGLTVNDALQCAVASVSAQVDASSGTSVVYKTASTGTTLRTKTLTLIAAPTTVPDKAV